jgi:hypothetical protein
VEVDLHPVERELGAGVEAHEDKLLVDRDEPALVTGSQ